GVGTGVRGGVVAVAIAEANFVGLSDVTGGQRGGLDLLASSLSRPVAAGWQRNVGCSADLADCYVGDTELLGDRCDGRGPDKAIELGAGESVGQRSPREANRISGVRSRDVAAICPAPAAAPSANCQPRPGLRPPSRHALGSSRRSWIRIHDR